jgi:hypothetical protein
VSIGVLALLVMNGFLLSRTSSSVITVEQASKVERAAGFLQDVGFSDPVYLGIKPGAEGEYPTFRATAIGGEPVELWLRTTQNGGWEIQPVGYFSGDIDSADDLARAAEIAVYEWENIPPDVQPRTDGAAGEYEGREYHYNLLARYVPDDSYWDQPRDETSGWPRTQ